MSPENTPEHQSTLESERAVNEQYLRKMSDMVDLHSTIARQQGTTRSQQWTNPSTGVNRTPVAEAVAAPLAGRVALEKGDDLIGESFYIGSWHQEWDGVLVVSWAAPVAGLFYRRRHASDSLADQVQACRTFVVGRSDIQDFVDDLEPDLAPLIDPFKSRTIQPLAVPRPPNPSVPRAIPSENREPARPHDCPTFPAVPQPTSTEACSPAVPDSTESEQPQSQPHQNGSESSSPDSTSNSDPIIHEIRAEEALRTVLERPKTGRLTSVLGTLQSDQYRLVTWADDISLVVQGSPGTGKTVVAAHRAAYLTHPEREPAPLQRVALVGPTDQYVQHVSDAVRELTFGVSLIDSPTGAQQKVNVMSLPNLLFELAGLPPNPTLDERESERLDTDWRLGRIVEKAASILKSEIQFPSNKAKAVKTLVDAIAHHDRRIRGYLESESDFEQWIIGIGSYDRARTKRRFLPFLAAAGLAVRPTKTTVQFDHLICDEAQDVRPLEWRILGKYLRPNAGLSLFGDINQRHSDWSPSTWHQLATDLELTDDDGGFEPEILTLGLRTTRQIVKFANQLLPSGERTVHALREGAEPTVRRVAFSGLAPDAAADAEALSLRYPEGQVAVISVTPRLVEDALRSRGWTRSNRPLAWSKEGRTVLALHPDLARGLEFDGVVVVEPSSFNPNLGRHGQLYTSLTRAVHELVVLHSERLPKGL